jgi:hypothetical protein
MTIQKRSKLTLNPYFEISNLIKSKLAVGRNKLEVNHFVQEKNGTISHGIWNAIQRRGY